ncbi:hypothetical protein ADUPG1_000899 [Aduncisulcus paluster]|uniref:Uncharacterized protein n=1 Tax=Aduncisulcus paluster TaxID=2918883 RepID=A0ABQ5K8F8_9EUKA|nr:hypothetical protein ADUPG1_000899 [Aduncisulcus paluster]
MKLFTLLLGFVVLLLLVIPGESVDYIDVWEDVPADEIYEVYYVNRPAFQDEFGPLLGFVGGMHAQMSFLAKDDSTKSFTYHYDTRDHYTMAAKFPYVGDDGYLVWPHWDELLCFHGHEFGPEPEYRWVIDNHISDITGDILNDIAASFWHQWNSTRRNYTMFELWDYWQNEEIFRGNQCMDMAQDMINWLHNVHDVDYFLDVDVNRTYMNLYGEPIGDPVDYYGNPVVRSEVNTWFTIISDLGNKTLQEWIYEVFIVYEGKTYYDFLTWDDDYNPVHEIFETKFNAPYAGIAYPTYYLPGQDVPM